MNKIEIYLIDDSLAEEGYWMQKGFRPYVIVKVDNEYYNITVYEYKEFFRECESSIQDIGFYSIDPNLIIVKELTKHEIIATVLYLYNDDNYYFSKLKPEKIDFIIKQIY